MNVLVFLLDLFKFLAVLVGKTLLVFHLVLEFEYAGLQLLLLFFVLTSEIVPKLNQRAGKLWRHFHDALDIGKLFDVLKN